MVSFLSICCSITFVFTWLLIDSTAFISFFPSGCLVSFLSIGSVAFTDLTNLTVSCLSWEFIVFCSIFTLTWLSFSFISFVIFFQFCWLMLVLTIFFFSFFSACFFSFQKSGSTIIQKRIYNSFICCSNSLSSKATLLINCSNSALINFACSFAKFAFNLSLKFCQKYWKILTISFFHKFQSAKFLIFANISIKCWSSFVSFWFIHFSHSVNCFTPANTFSKSNSSTSSTVLSIFGT